MDRRLQRKSHKKGYVNSIKRLGFTPAPFGWKKREHRRKQGVSRTAQSVKVKYGRR